MRVQVRYFAGAAAAAGVDDEDVEVAPQALLSDLATVIGRRHGPELTRVLAACSFLLDEVAGSPDRALREGARVDVLPPFAGG